MSSLSLAITSVCFGLWLLANVLIVLAWREFWLLKRRASTPSVWPLPPDALGRDFPLAVLASDYADNLTTAVTHGTLGVFDVSNRTLPLRNRAAGYVGVIRALAGVLILFGLLITLFNLQASVRTLGDTFHTLSKQQASNTAAGNGAVDEIQQSMGNIAISAQRAFTFSAYVIAMAAWALLAAIPLQRQAVMTVNAFVDWAEQAHGAACSAQLPAGEASQIQELAGVITRMDTVVAGLEKLGHSMTSLAELGGKLDESTKLISTAIDRLPETVKSSVGQLSSEVAREITADLGHQTQHIAKILAIYGEQEIRMKLLYDGFKITEQSVREASAALKSLALLPENIEKLAAAIVKTAEVSIKVEAGVRSLDTKVSALPLADMERAIQGIDTGIAALQGAGGQVLALTTRADSVFQEWRKEVASVAPHIAEEVNNALVPAFQDLKGAVKNADLPGIHLALGTLVKNSTELSRKLDQGRDSYSPIIGGLARVESALKEVQRDVEEPFWKHLTRRREHGGSARS